MEIYILRHGIAEDGKPGRPDSERALTDDGRAKLKKVMQRARDAGVEPSLVLSSPFVRALETAEIAAEVLGYKGKIVKTRALEPDVSPHEVWKEIRSRSGENAVLLASHEPLCGSLVAFLLNCPALKVDVKKAALIRIDCDGGRGVADGVLRWMLTPALA